MGVIARAECRKCGNVSEAYARPGRCVDDRCNGEMVEVEYVPATQLRGAVEDRDTLASLLIEAVRQDFGTPGWRARAIKAGVLNDHLGEQ